MKQKEGTFIMIDGIAGSGKSTALQAFANMLERAGNSVFQLREWEKRKNMPPHYEKVKDHDVFFTLEPTHNWIGAAIRQELSRDDEPYGGEELAHAFALDRQILYRQLIVPALKDGKIVIQDRGISSSIVYQPIMKNTISLKKLLSLPGNKLALNYAPDHLILTEIPVEKAVQRIRKRSGASRGVFANKDLLERWRKRFASDWFRDLFERQQTDIHTLNTSQSKDTMIAASIEILNSVLQKTPIKR